MAQAVALVLAAIGGAFAYAAIASKGILLTIPSPDTAVLYYLTVAFVAFVNAILFASANTRTD